LYYGRCVGARMLPTVSSLASEQAVPTSATMLRLDRLLGYAFSHPNGRKFYWASDMILRVLSHASYLSRPKAGSVRCRIPPFPRSSRRRRVPEPPHLQALNPHPRGLLLRGRGPNMPASMPRRGSPSMSGVFSPTWVIHSHQPPSFVTTRWPSDWPTTRSPPRCQNRLTCVFIGCRTVCVKGDFASFLFRVSRTWLIFSPKPCLSLAINRLPLSLLLTTATSDNADENFQAKLKLSTLLFAAVCFYPAPSGCVNNT
jgi:hypothetical protein